MNEIKINASKPYCVYVGEHILPELGDAIKNTTLAEKIAIISDTNVWPLYEKNVIDSLNHAGYFDIYVFIIQAGEQSKNGTNFLRIMEFLAENQITRSDCLIAFGGGVVGDLAGFSAACFLRGIDYIQVPTTLLACVDSSVGGKTAIDLHSGKNLAGAFYHPKLVFCDIGMLSTLPDHVFRDGCAEVIKYGILYDEELFDHLSARGIAFDRTWVITRCIELKRDVVFSDEFDTGVRQKLNLGHTFGHGIETVSMFSVTHGQAVSIGTAIITRAAAKLGICSVNDEIRILSVLKKFGLPVSTDFSAEEIFKIVLSDKKRSGSNVNLIIPEKIGLCRIQPTQTEDIPQILQAGL